MSAGYGSLPKLSNEYHLSDEQVKNYRKKGHVLLREVASTEEVNVYRPIIYNAAKRFNTETRNLEERDTYGKAFLQIMNLWTRDIQVKSFTMSRRFAKIAADLMGVRGVRIYHDQALFKEASGGPTPWHQDQHYFPLDTDNIITMWMPLVPVSVEMGVMRFASGSHTVGYLGDLPISDKSEEELSKLVADKGFNVETYGMLNPGDATFHAGWTLHSTAANTTPVMREVMTIIYHDIDARVIEPDSKSRATDLSRWLPGLKPGDIAASPINPIVYEK
jgi:ectoine hydroxylase-related dioxygenase (phytanoyl-CoA dioxygenase family)